MMSNDHDHTPPFRFPELEEKLFLEKLEKLETSLDDLEQKVLQTLSEVEIPDSWLEEWEKFTESDMEPDEEKIRECRGRPVHPSPVCHVPALPRMGERPVHRKRVLDSCPGDLPGFSDHPTVNSHGSHVPGCSLLHAGWKNRSPRAHSFSKNSGETCLTIQRITYPGTSLFQENISNAFRIKTQTDPFLFYQILPWHSLPTAFHFRKNSNEFIMK